MFNALMRLIFWAVMILAGAFVLFYILPALLAEHLPAYYPRQQ